MFWSELIQLRYDVFHDVMYFMYLIECRFGPDSEVYSMVRSIYTSLIGYNPGEHGGHGHVGLVHEPEQQVQVLVEVLEARDVVGMIESRRAEIQSGKGLEI